MSKRKQEPVDWAEVRAAQKRLKYGRGSYTDQQLCERAYAADAQRYVTQKQEVDGEVFREVAQDWFAPAGERREQKR